MTLMTNPGVQQKLTQELMNILMAIGDTVEVHVHDQKSKNSNSMLKKDWQNKKLKPLQMTFLN